MYQKNFNFLLINFTFLSDKLKLIKTKNYIFKLIYLKFIYYIDINFVYYFVYIYILGHKFKN
jgi:hypothetical protein